MIATVLVKLPNHPPAHPDLPQGSAIPRERRYTPFAFLVFAFLLSFNSMAQFQLSESFGNMGKTSFSPDTYHEALDILTLDNDTLLVLANAGHLDSVFDNDIVLAKLSPNGQIVTGYGDNGLTRFDFPGLTHSIADEMVKLDDGSVLVLGSGYSFDSTNYLPTCIAKVSNNGGIDSSFGTNGFKVFEFAGLQDYPNSIEKDALGRILVSGSTLDTGHLHSDVPVIARMDIDGNLDPSFGEGGKVYLRFTNGVIQETRDSRHFSGGVVYDLLDTDDGKLLISGAHSNGVNYIAFIARLNEDGSLDSSFFDGGYLAFDIYPYENSIGVKLLKGENNTVWLGAHTQALDYNDFFFAQIDLTHTSYNVGTIDIEDNEDFVMDMLMEPNGLPLLIGSSRKPENNELHYHSDYFSVAQLTAENFPYSSDNYLHEFNLGYQSGAVAATFQSDGRLVCLGFSNLDSTGANELALIGLEYSSTGIDDKQLQALVYPNPTQDYVRVQMERYDNYSVEIYNSVSQLVYQGSFYGFTSGNISLERLSPGIYPMRISKTNGENYHTVIVKK